MIKLKSPAPFTLWQIETLVWSEHAYDMQPIPTRVTPSKHYDALGYWQTYASISASKSEANPKIVRAHWKDGGTGLTNFPKQNLAKYDRAIKLHGDERFVIDKRPMDMKRSIPSGYSLHMIPAGDASQFWKTFRKLSQN